MDRERFELADLVDAVLDAAKPMLDASKLAVEKELVPMEAVADCQCIRQAMLALLENSCRFAASGGILRCQTELVADGFIAIHIHDRGPGFPENTGEVTVNPFWRGDTSRSRATGGTGLGLSVVQAITTAHSEKLEFCNRPGGGATVSILIPREFTECPS